MLLFYVIPMVLAARKKYPVAKAFRVIDLYPIFLVELAHLFFQINFYCGVTYYVRFARVIQVTSLLSLLLPILRRKLYKPGLVGAGMTFLGTMMNKIVIDANGGLMPVYPTLSRLIRYMTDGQLTAGTAVDSLHILMTGSTKLNFLADYIDLGMTVLSPGDLCVHSFIAIIVYYTIKALAASDPVKE